MAPIDGIETNEPPKPGKPLPLQVIETPTHPLDEAYPERPIMEDPQWAGHPVAFREHHPSSPNAKRPIPRPGGSKPPGYSTRIRSG